MPSHIRDSVSETLIIIGKNMGLRKIFMRGNILHRLMDYSLDCLNEDCRAMKKKGKMQFSFNCIKLLCLICTPKTNKFYIPGETNLAERLRKRAFDTGTFTLLSYIYHQLKDRQMQELVEIREHIREKVLSYSDLNDLSYHVRLLKHLKEQLE